MFSSGVCGTLFEDAITDSTKQRVVPALAESIKVAGLVLITDTSGDSKSKSTAAAVNNAPSSVGGPAPSAAAFFGTQTPEGVDGLFTADGVLRFHETIDM